jgi:hypothetical protein
VRRSVAMSVGVEKHLKKGFWKSRRLIDFDTVIFHMLVILARIKRFALKF